MISNKKILITGAAGFIGSHLTKKLVKKNTIHLVLKRSTNLWRIKEIIPHVSIHYTPLDNKEKLKLLMTKIKPQLIFHFASYGNSSDEQDPLSIIKINFISTANLILSLDHIPYECFINTGSSSEYGFKNKAMKETDEPFPNSFYAVSKLSSTQFCTMHAKSRKKPIVTLRPFSVYGPYEENNRLIPTVINNIIDEKPIKLTPQDVRRDFIFIDDLIDGYVKIPNHINTELYGEVFNLGSGEQHSNSEVVNALIKLFNKRVKIVKGAFKNRSWDSKYWLSDISKAKRLLQWKPKHTLIQGLKKTADWFTHYEERKQYYG